MKTRSGFVSNSSSSSFILYGFDVSDRDDITRGYFEGPEDGLKEGQKIVGERILFDEEDGGGTFTPNLDVLENIRQLHKIPKHVQWKVYYGVCMS